ncbi:MAG: DUF364 domain-containing protein [Gammaproteobacteria bacterium]|jgi:uncharacterized protein
MTNSWELYDLLQDTADGNAAVEEVLLGVGWTLCRTEGAEALPGLSMSPPAGVRTLPWAGTLVGRPLGELQAWVRSWDPHEAAVGMAAVNAGIGCAPALAAQTVPLATDGPANLAVFEHFLPRLAGKRVTVVGRYPGLERYAQLVDMTVLERSAGPGDLPDPACEYVLPESEWVFLTATSIPNKTFPRLAELSRDANLVLMGPTAPWLRELRDFGVDFLAGTLVHDRQALRRTIAEGGGTRIFEDGVGYHLLDLGRTEMTWVGSTIADLVGYRERLTREMETWYGGGRHGTFPKIEELLRVDRELSVLDLQFKRLWDARHGRVMAA